MSDVRIVKLGDLCDIVIGRTPARKEQKFWGGDIPWLSITDMNQGTSITRTKEKITEAGARNGKLVPPGTVLFSFKLSIGKVGIAKIPLYTNEAIVSLPIKDTSMILPEYLMRFLEACNFDLQGNRAAMGKTLNKKSLHEIEISVPSIRRQLEIVTILSKIKKIQETRKRQLAALDELASSLFVKYFGHPSLSPKYKTVSIGDICKVATGNSPSKKDINNYGNVIEWVKSDNLGGLHPSKAKEYLSEQGKDKGRVAPPGSILVTCIAGSRNSIGKCSLVDREITFNQQINAIYPSNNILSDFLYYQIKIFPYLVQEKISGGMKGIVNKSKFESIKIILPPKEIQEEFSKITQRIRIQKEYAKKSLDLSKNLFSSLELNLFYH
jgi:restriction modification system DNA specificity domain protein